VGYKAKKKIRCKKNTTRRGLWGGLQLSKPLSEVSFGPGYDAEVWQRGEQKEKKGETISLLEKRTVWGKS